MEFMIDTKRFPKYADRRTMIRKLKAAVVVLATVLEHESNLRSAQDSRRKNYYFDNAYDGGTISDIHMSWPREYMVVCETDRISQTPKIDNAAK